MVGVWRGVVASRAAAFSCLAGHSAFYVSIPDCNGQVPPGYSCTFTDILVDDGRFPKPMYDSSDISVIKTLAHISTVSKACIHSCMSVPADRRSPAIEVCHKALWYSRWYRSRCHMMLAQQPLRYPQVSLRISTADRVHACARIRLL